MAQRVFTFKSPVDKKSTIGMINNVVLSLNGKIKIHENMIVAKWRSKKYRTVFSQKFTFYVGEDRVRIITKDSSKDIRWEYPSYGVLRIWDEFINALQRIYPQFNFYLSSGKTHIVEAMLMSDGIEQKFGSVGSMIGNIAISAGTVKESIGKSVLVTVRYSNGMVLDGEISKKSKVYNRIIVDLCNLGS